MDPYLGMLFTMGFNFAPRGYALCAGQLIAISQNTALFSILGTYYGGNGTSNFALPDLQGRGAVGQGQNVGGSYYDLGEEIGQEAVTITQLEMPIHNHLVNALTSPGDQSTPAGFILAEGPKTGTGPGSKSTNMYTTAVPNTNLNPLTIGVAGSSVPIGIMQPFLTINICIATSGIFPARN